MKVLIDGDSCSVIEEAGIISKRYGLPVQIYADIQRELQPEYGRVYYVNPRKDAADMEILRHIKKKDIVITADYGLAALVLAKGGGCIHPHGFVYTENNILSLLNYKHYIKKARKGKHKRVRKYGPYTRCNFKRDFCRLIEENLICKAKKDSKRCVRNDKIS